MSNEFNLYAGRFSGNSSLETSSEIYNLYSSSNTESSQTPFYSGSEREGQYAIVKASLSGKGLYSCSIVELLNPISSQLLDHFIKKSPTLKHELGDLVRTLRNDILGEPVVQVKSDEPSLDIRPSSASLVCALVVGHRKSAKGAQGVLKGKTINEYDYHSELAEMIVERTKHVSIITVYRDDTKQGYAKLPGKINQLKPDFVVSLHANAHNTKASGTETLYYKGSKKGLKLAKIVQEKLLSACGLANRKVKSKVKSDRGGSLLSGTNAPAIIGEPFFIDNPNDLSVAVSKKAKIAKAYAEAIDEYALSFTGSKVTATAHKVTKSKTLKVDLDFKYKKLTKKQFLTKNKAIILQLIDGVNSILNDQYGANYVALTQTDFWVLFNSEAGLRSGKVDVDHVHSEGERGVLPLPSNLKFWNGDSAPSWDRPMPLGKNIEHFMIYLGQLKNKKVAKRNNKWMYQALFQGGAVKGNENLQARILSGVVHGYFYYGNFKDKKVPTAAILKGFIENKPLPAIMKNTSYVHAGTDIIVNRESNIAEAIAMV